MSQYHREGGFDLVEPLEGPPAHTDSHCPRKLWRGVPATMLRVAQPPTLETTPSCTRKLQHRVRQEVPGESAGKAHHHGPQHGESPNKTGVRRQVTVRGLHCSREVEKQASLDTAQQSQQRKHAAGKQARGEWPPCSSLSSVFCLKNP